jgi:hypothetical protein
MRIATEIKPDIEGLLKQKTVSNISIMTDSVNDRD